jgi:hypothetical protein
MTATPDPAAPQAGDVLIIRHGPGRGRNLELLPQVEQRIAESRPALSGRIRVYETGGTQPSLGGVVAVLFLLGDPLREQYPECFAEAVAIAEAARARGARVLNPPENLSNSIKSRQAEIWRKAGFPCAAARVLRSSADLEPAMAALGLPMIVRSDEGHVQEGVRVLKRVRKVDEAKHTTEFPAVALQLIDVRAKWRETAPDSLYARYYHKKRAMVFGDVVRNNHIFFSRSPIVGRATSTFVAATRRAHRALRALGVGRKRFHELLKADYEYFAGPPEAPEMMLAATRALGVDTAAIDYATLPDGSIVLWEANPYVHLPPWQHAVLARERRIPERTASHVEEVAGWLERLATGVGVPPAWPRTR